jgi:hypothetical protein
MCGSILHFGEYEIIEIKRQKLVIILMQVILFLKPICSWK